MVVSDTDSTLPGGTRAADASGSNMREMRMEDRPRERLAALGAEALRDAELLAILFRTGTRELGAVALAEQTMQQFGALHRLGLASLEELQQINGLGRVKAIEIKAALELGKRMATYARRPARRISSSRDVADLLATELRLYETEHFVCIELTAKNDVIKSYDVSRGSLDATGALPRDVFRQAIRDGAGAVIVAHNHPSGDPEPSEADIVITKRLAAAADLLGMRLLDHVVIGDGRHVSLKDRGLF